MSNVGKLMAINEVLEMAVAGKSVRMILEFPGEGMSVDLTGYVEQVTISEDTFDGVIAACFTLVGRSSEVSEVAAPFLSEEADQAFDFAQKRWLCAYCSTENSPEGKDGNCTSCGGSKGESLRVAKRDNENG